MYYPKYCTARDATGHDHNAAVCIVVLILTSPVGLHRLMSAFDWIHQGLSHQSSPHATLDGSCRFVRIHFAPILSRTRHMHMVTAKCRVACVDA